MDPRFDSQNKHPRDAREPRGAGTVDKAIDVLFHLHDRSRPCGVSELGRALGLPKSSVHRLLTALGQRGLVERDARGRYRPGMGLVALGLGVLEREPVVEAARPEMERIAAELGETLFLAGARAGRIHVLAKVEGTGFLRAAPRVGATVPVHATAVGKLHLAFAPDEVGPDAAPARFTSRTLDPVALAREVDEVRRRGWASNRDEWTPGLTAVAAPVWLGGRLRAVLAVAGPTAALEERDLPARARSLLAATARIEARLEGRAVWRTA